MHPPRVGVGAVNRIYTMGAALLEMDLIVLRGRIDFREGRDVRLHSYIKKTGSLYRAMPEVGAAIFNGITRVTIYVIGLT